MMIEKKWDGVKISARDKRFFLDCLHHKFLTLDHARKLIFPDGVNVPECGRPALYFRLRRLVNAGYLRKQLLHGHAVYLLDKRGLDEIRDLNKYNLFLVPPKELKNVEHDLAVADVRYYLEQQAKGEWISERAILHQAENLTHVPDGGFVLNQKIVGIEVELTRKSTDRYRELVQFYAVKGPQRVVHFYRDPIVVQPFIEMTRHMGRLGFFPFPKDPPPMDQVIGQTQGRRARLDEFLGLERSTAVV